MIYSVVAKAAGRMTLIMISGRMEAVSKSYQGHLTTMDAFKSQLEEISNLHGYKTFHNLD